MDIAPAIDTPEGFGHLSPHVRMLAIEETGIVQGLLDNIAKNFPGRVFAADAASALPFRNNSFDLVVSCMALPGYAASIYEAKRSIMEMVRVARERVVFSGGWQDDQQGTIRVGTGEGVVFPLKQFLDSLHNLGIAYAQKYSIIGDEGGHRRSIHLNVSSKNLSQVNSPILPILID